MAGYRKKQKEQRQKEAKARDLARSKRTPEQQMCLVATRRGDSKKEAVRLVQLIAQKEKK